MAESGEVRMKTFRGATMMRREKGRIGRKCKYRYDHYIGGRTRRAAWPK